MATASGADLSSHLTGTSGSRTARQDGALCGPAYRLDPFAPSHANGAVLTSRPWLLPATMAKPQVGLPVFLTRFSRLGFWVCAGVAVASLAVMPNWPMAWWRQAGNYQYFIPLLVLPGPLILAALWRYRDRDSLLLVLSALMPQRWFFDTFTLWLIPQSRREIVWTVFFSWGAGIWRWYRIPHTSTEVGRATVLFLYLPMLAVVLLRRVPRTQGSSSNKNQANQRNGDHQSRYQR